MMKKFDISILVVSFILIIMLICSLRSEWQNLVVTVESAGYPSRTQDFQRTIFESVNVIQEKNYTISALMDGTCKTITGLGALSTILLFISIINIFKTHIKFIDSKLYPYFEKVALAINVLVSLFCLISFIVSFKLEFAICSTENCDILKLKDELKYSKEIKTILGDMSFNVTEISTPLAGFKLMVTSFVIALLAFVVSIFRFREITSPSSSIDYRFLYSGESSFLDDADAADITGDGEDDTFPTQVNF